MPHRLEQNLAVMWNNAVRRYGDKPCMRHKLDGDWQTYTYKDVDERVRAFALGLIQLGLAPGDSVALLSENRPEWAITDLAVQSAGGALSTIFATNTPKLIGYIVADSQSKILVVSNYFQLRKALESKDIQRTVRHIIIFDPIRDITDADERILSMTEVMNRGKGLDSGELDRRTQAIGPDDLATIIYTSGTTGDPKGVMLTHGNLLSNVRVSQSLFHLRPTDVALSVLPLSHSFERTAGHFGALFSGGTVAYSEGMDHFNAELIAVRPTVLVGVPRIYEKIMARIQDAFGSKHWLVRQVFARAVAVGKDATAYRLRGRGLPAYLDLQHQALERAVFKGFKDQLGGRLRFMISGGAPLAVEIAEFFFAAGIPLYEGYGLTESSPVVSVNCPGSVKLGTVGRPIPGVEVQIGEQSEILVRGPNVMKGYHKLPMETAQVIRGGWLHTGDQGAFDSEGFLRVTGRIKDIIITSGGKNIAPQCLETLLELEEPIKQVCVVGDRRPYLSAVIVPDFAAVKRFARAQKIAFSREKDLLKHPAVEEWVRRSIEKVNGQVPSFENVQKFILSDSEFTQENGMLTATLKVRRKGVELRFGHEIDQLY